MSDPSRPPPPASGYPVPPNGHPPPPSGVAYPYQAPPPANSYYYNQPFYSNPRSIVIRRFFTALALIAVIFFLILFICWLVIRPRHPQFHLTSLSLSNLNVSTQSQRVSGNWNSRFQVYNPNKKMEIDYDYVVASIAYRSEVLGEVRVPPFDQGKKNRTELEAAWMVKDAYVDGWVVTGISGDRSKGTVGFNVKVEATVEFKLGSLRARRRFLRVFCDDVAVTVSANSGSGNLGGGSRECKVFV